MESARFVRDTVLAAIAAGYDFRPYDQDGNGEVDVVSIVHAGRDQASGGGPNAIWSHRSSLTGFGLAKINANGVLIDDYVIQAEIAGDLGIETIGVFVHEHGHALGLPDLYDNDYSSLGIGVWSGMSFGSNNGILRGGDCPAHFDAWCKIKLGWVTPINYTLNVQNVTFPSAHATPFAARLWKDGIVGPQYFLVENRYTNGFDRPLPAAGLLIWHIDESKLDTTGNTREWYPISPGGNPPKTLQGNPLVALMQADNLWQLAITNRSNALPTSARGNDGDAGGPLPRQHQQPPVQPDLAAEQLRLQRRLDAGLQQLCDRQQHLDAGTDDDGRPLHSQPEQRPGGRMGEYCRACSAG